ncbi:MAG: flippase [Saprospiraceae bacterium]|nr:flippase [Saprospiraceae bacterium]
MAAMKSSMEKKGADSIVSKVLSLFEKLKGNTDVRKISVNTIWLVADKGIRVSMSLLVGVWVARYFGPVNYGVYSYSIAFIAIFSALSTLGIDSLVVRDLVNRPDRINTTLGSSALLKLFSGIGSALLACIIIFLLKGDESNIAFLVVIMSASFLIVPLDVIDFFFQSKLQSKYTILARLSALIITNVLRVIAIISSLSLFIFGTIQVIEAILGALLLIFLYQYSGNKISEWKVDFQYLKALFISSFGLLADSLLVIINMQIDRIILEYFHGEFEVGVYSVAVNLTQLWYFIPVFVGASTVPYMVTKIQESYSKYERVLKLMFSIMTYSSLAIAIFFTFASGFVVQFLFGSTYMNAAPILSVYIWTCVLVFHVSIRSRSLIIEEKSKYVGLFSLLMTSLNVLLNLTLVSKYGGMGAAISSISAWAMSVLIFPLFFKSTRKYSAYFFKSFLLKRWALELQSK